MSSFATWNNGSIEIPLPGSPKQKRLIVTTRFGGIGTIKRVTFHDQTAGATGQPHTPGWHSCAGINGYDQLPNDTEMDRTIVGPPALSPAEIILITPEYADGDCTTHSAFMKLDAWEVHETYSPPEPGGTGKATSQWKMQLNDTAETIIITIVIEDNA